MKSKRDKYITLILVVIALITFTGLSVLADYAADEDWTGTFTSKSEKEKLESICPKTRMSTDCFKCHVAPDFSLKETDPYRIYDLPWGTDIVEGKLYYKIGDLVASQPLQNVFKYMSWHPEFEELIIELHSPGGSLAEAWKAVSLISEAQAKGIKVTTRVYGLAASAAFVIFCAGDEREVGRLSEIMHHELWTFTFLSIDTPSSKEQEALTLRHLQTTIHTWLISKCRKSISLDELDKLVKHKDYWMNGQDAIDAGFADKFIGE